MSNLLYLCFLLQTYPTQASSSNSDLCNYNPMTPSHRKSNLPCRLAMGSNLVRDVLISLPGIQQCHYAD